MAVRIRMKKMGRSHRHFFRICAIDKRSPRDGRVLEELGTYDPMITDADARAVLKRERIDHWLSVGAQPSEKFAVLIKKYGSEGTHLDAQKAALEKLSLPFELPDPGPPVSTPQSDEPEAAAEEAKSEEAKSEEAKPEEAAADDSKGDDSKGDDPKPEAPAAEEAKADEKPAEEAPAKEEAKSE